MIVTDMTEMTPPSFGEWLRIQHSLPSEEWRELTAIFGYPADQSRRAHIEAMLRAFHGTGRE